MRGLLITIVTCVLVGISSFIFLTLLDVWVRYSSAKWLENSKRGDMEL